METLNELSQLRDSGFGQPWPRHGLKLLYWFAKNCFSFKRKNTMLSKCDPTYGDFGFHSFENRCDECGDTLLPVVNIRYYVVGNLNSPGAEELPEYVSEDTYTDLHNRNSDRIIVSLYDEEWFHRVYVTQHHDRSNYDPKATYRISRGLLMILRRMSLEDLLNEMGYTYFRLLLSLFNSTLQTTDAVNPDFTAVTPSSSDSDDSEPPETQRDCATIQINNNKETCYYTHILPKNVVNYRPQTTDTVSPDFTAVTPSSSDSDDSEPPAAQINYTKIQLDNDKKKGYYTHKEPVLQTPLVNYRPQTTTTVRQDFTPSSSDPTHNKHPDTQINYTTIQTDDNEMTSHYKYTQPLLSTPVDNYRPPTTSRVSPEFTAVTPSSSDPTHIKPPQTQRNYTKIQLDNDKTGHYTYKQPVLQTPVVIYRPQTTSSPNFTPLSSVSDDNESLETENNDTIIQFDEDMSSLNSSENLPKKKGFCKRCCTIL